MTVLCKKQRGLQFLTFCLCIILVRPCAGQVPPVGPSGPVGGTLSRPTWGGGWGRTPEEKRRARELREKRREQKSRAKRVDALDSRVVKSASRALKKDIIKFKASDVSAPSTDVTLPLGRKFFGVGEDIIDFGPARSTRRNKDGRGKIWTKGTKISTKNLQRSLSILQHMSGRPMSDEDASFLAQQAGFALEENVPLEVVVQDAPLKLPLTPKAAREFQELLDNTLRIENGLAEIREMRRGLLPKIREIEKKLGKAEQGSPPIGPEDIEKLPAEDRDVLDRFAKLFEGEQRKKTELKENQKATKEFVKRYVDLSVSLD